MRKWKLALAAALCAAMLALPSLNLVAGWSAFGWSVRTAVTLACDPAQGSGCGG